MKTSTSSRNKRPTRIDDIITGMQYAVCVCVRVKCEHAARNKFSVESQDLCRCKDQRSKHEVKNKKHTEEDTTSIGNNNIKLKRNQRNAKSAIFILHITLTQT